MKYTSLLLAASLAAVMAPLAAQQLQQPTVPTTRPVTPPANSGVGPQLQQTQAPPPAVLSDPAQRQPASSPVPSTGPAQDVPTGPDARTLQKGRPASVLDSNGRPVNGMLQVAPNRVYDPATGRYHWTDTAGQQQKLRD
ncbi:MAG: classical arabinogalactan protein 4 [Burkholderiales bacterium]|nr:MAG: classical arabinogalactan protein 4 [Burkholderiales bacterium]